MSREQDEQIAERLFGWKWMAFDGIPIKGTPDYPRKQRVRQFLSGKQLSHESWQEFRRKFGNGRLELSADSSMN